jgi:predicted glycoside hydrolase/deacetylase ChbG (UPF0249 family)
MDPNPVLSKLGYSNDDRVVIIHTDDIGMCQASVSAFSELWEFGVISSGSVMVPCPWFLEIAKIAREIPNVDLGVHVTLTSEWDTYRWGPISTRDPTSGLIDSEGYFFRSSKEVWEHSDPEAVQVEIKAQIDRALYNGIQVTHADTHMGSVVSQKIIPLYLQLVVQYGLPSMVIRLDKQGFMEMGFDETLAEFGVQMVAGLEEEGVPLLDRISGLDLDRAKNKAERIKYAQKIFSELQPGITHFIIHPSVDTPELRAITPDWPCRVADYEAFRSNELREIIKNLGIQVIGYSQLKALMNQ